MATQVPKSEFAEIYGEGSVYDGVMRSELTPVRYSFQSDPSRILDRNLYDRNIYVEDTQRRELYSYTTRELSDLDALLFQRSLPQGNLNGAVLPCLMNWEDSLDPNDGRVKALLASSLGHYLFSDPKVKEFVMPALIIATNLFEACKHTEFFRTIMTGRRVQVKSRVPVYLNIDPKVLDRLVAIVPLAVAPSLEAVDQEINSRLKELEPRFELNFMWDTPATGDVSDTLYGLTYETSAPKPNMSPVSTPHLRISLSLIRYGLPFKYDLSDAERMALQFDLGVTIFHEFIHALDMVRVICELENQINSIPPNSSAVHKLEYHDPYYHQEPWAHLPTSGEFQMLGGIHSLMRLDNRKDTTRRSLGYWVTDPWIKGAGYGWGFTGPVLRGPAIPDIAQYYPIPVGYYAKVQSQEFWDVAVKSFGIEMLFDSVRRAGVQEDATVPSPYTKFQDYYQTDNQNGNMFEARAQGLATLVNATPDERRALAFAEDMIRHMKRGESFWKNSQEQREMIHTMIENPKLLENQSVILGKFMDVIRMHEESAAIILESEQKDMTDHFQRRADFLHFNKGLRDFMRECGMDFESHLRSYDWNRMGSRLNYCFLYIFNPADSRLRDVVRDTTQFHQISALEDVYRKRNSESDLDRIAKEYDDMQNFATQNPYVPAIALNIARFGIIRSCCTGPVSGTTLSIEERLELWDRGFDFLTDTKNHIPVNTHQMFHLKLSAEWKNLIQEWELLAHDIRSKIDSEASQIKNKQSNSSSSNSASPTSSKNS